jgi:hypothetical protein
VDRQAAAGADLEFGPVDAQKGLPVGDIHVEEAIEEPGIGEAAAIDVEVEHARCRGSPRPRTGPPGLDRARRGTGAAGELAGLPSQLAVADAESARRHRRGRDRRPRSVPPEATQLPRQFDVSSPSIGVCSSLQFIPVVPAEPLTRDRRG